MILIISTCRYKLSEEEFVDPIREIVESEGFRAEVKHYMEKPEYGKYDKIIICGTALKDFNYLKNLQYFNKLKNLNKPVLGICAGYQILALLYGNRLEEIRKIGLYRVRVVKENSLTARSEFEAYFLHIYSLSKANEKIEVIALQDEEIAIFKIRGKPYYAISFYPEVLNPEIIKNFIRKV